MTEPATTIPSLSLSPMPTIGLSAPPPDLASQIADLARQEAALHEKMQALAVKAEGVRSAAQEAGHAAVGSLGRLEIFHGYMWVFVVSFLVALLVTPIMRRLAIANGVVDRPSVARKVHRTPVAYLGGVAVYLGILAGIFFAYTQPWHGALTFHPTARDVAGLPGGVPLSVVLGMTVIMLCGLWDDVVGIDPRAKIAGMLFAAAALASSDVGVKVASGVLLPMARALGIPTTASATPGGLATIAFHVPLPVEILGYHAIPIDVVYWVGTAVIAVFVLGACNASNLIDGLDGLLSGTTAIANIGLLIIALGLAMHDDGPLDGARIVMGLAVLGACLGFLPHNFNPATIFLGDAGSLLLGYCTIVIVLMLGDTGQTHLVLAGVIIYAIPIIDTTLAIVRRKMSGRSISEADDQHLHHILKRALGVKGAVFVLYGIGVGFAALGVLLSEGRQRVVYGLVAVVASYIGVIALKIGRREHIEREMNEAEARRSGAPGNPPAPKASQDSNEPRTPTQTGAAR
ncbi:MAG TPA: MraY family glycosyltransferase [Phycisphaerales bacterium]|nr:MraY family glycosyltransferase [Phycisphaerales bacterium]